MTRPFIHLEGKVAIVTGASRGIGEAIATTFAGAGANVVIASRKIESLREVEAKIRAGGGEALAHACHTGSREQVEALVGAAVAAYGQVDVLVNNAATNPHFGPFLTVDKGQWDKTFDVNLRGYFECARSVAKHLSDRDAPGSIVNVASIVALAGTPLQGVYAMTKAAVVSMTKTLAVELAAMNVRVNAIAPGIVETRFASALTNNPQIAEVMLSRVPMKRFGQPHEIAGAALYLASDAASYCTGHVLVVDGGFTASGM